jgi:hypothetical protein
VVGDNYTHGGAVDPNSAGNDDIAGDAGNDTIVGDSFDTAASGGTPEVVGGGHDVCHGGPSADGADLCEAASAVP